MQSSRLRAVLLAIGGLSIALSAAARHRNREGEATPGDFSYYLLSLSWSPAFCLSATAAPECGGPRGYGFIVHGLWPQYESGWPEHCDVHVAVDDSVVRDISDLMPARSLVYHEWATHGTCSGLDPQAFFALARRAYASVALPAQLTETRQAVESSPADVAAAFARSNPGLPPQSIVVTCSGQSAPRLREVRVCFDRALHARQCSADALRSACRAATLLIPPIR